MFRGAELTRLVTGLVMLAVIYQLIMWARNGDTWRWWVGDRQQPAVAARQARTPKPPPPLKLPPATGPTDEDPDQAETAKEEFQALTDGTLTLGPEEMEPYDRLVEWVKNQSYARLYARAKKGLRYTDLHDDVEKHRGELVALDVDLQLANDAGKNRFGVPLSDAWGVTDESVGRFYTLIVLDFPAGIPRGHFIREKARFVGYFLKLQGYEPGAAKPGQAPEKAPLLIGRLQWEPAAVVEPPIDSWQEWTVGLSLLALLGVAFALRWGYMKWFRPRPVARPLVSDAASGEPISIEAWLERSSFGSTDPQESPQGEHDVLHGNGKPGIGPLDGEDGKG
jgi:hypothetical protein